MKIKYTDLQSYILMKKLRITILMMKAGSITILSITQRINYNIRKNKLVYEKDYTKKYRKII